MNFRFFKLIFISIFLLIVVSFIYRLYFVNRSIRNGRDVYEITVQGMGTQTPDTYVTDEYRIDPESKCVIFKDEYGFTKTVCGFYTVTKY